MMTSKLPDIRPHITQKWDESLSKSASVKPCCKTSSNLLVVDVNDVAQTAIRVCRVCGTKHRYMHAEFGTLRMLRHG